VIDFLSGRAETFCTSAAQNRIAIGCPLLAIEAPPDPRSSRHPYTCPPLHGREAPDVCNEIRATHIGE